MHIPSSLLVPSLLFVSSALASALPDPVAGTCTKNKCLRVVKSNKLHASYAGCKSFLRTYTTQEPVTTTSTSFTTTTTNTVPVTVKSGTSTVYGPTTTITLAAPEETTSSSPAKLAKRAGSAVPSYASAACANVAAYSSACSCVGYSATTVTLPPQTKTSTVVVSTAAETSVTVATAPVTTITATSTKTEYLTSEETSEGMIFWGYTSSDAGPYSNRPFPVASYDPRVNDEWERNGITQNINNLLYSGIVPQGYFTYNFQGYFVPQITGDYTFAPEANNALDDIIMMWAGDKAHKSYTWDNKIWIGTCCQSNPAGGPGSLPYTVTLEVGQLLPMTFMYANTGGSGEFQLQVTDPFGDTTKQLAGMFVYTLDAVG